MDTVTRDSSFPSVDTGFSYELTRTFLDNSAGSSWRESCVLNGSPGEVNSFPCPDVCYQTKCRKNGDSTATCNAQNECVCSANYYFNSNLRTCSVSLVLL